MSIQEINFKPATLAMIETAKQIISGSSVRMNLRQIYYQLVSHHGLPNGEKSYNRVKSIIGDARLAGLIGWEEIEDRTRRPVIPQDFADLKELVATAINAYKLPRWQDQDTYVEVWCEKEALGGVIEPLTREYHVAFQVNKGYSSLTTLYDASMRIKEKQEGRPAVVLYVGDFDPSGEAAWRTSSTSRTSRCGRSRSTWTRCAATDSPRTPPR